MSGSSSDLTANPAGNRHSLGCRCTWVLPALVLAFLPVPAQAGPPFLTDDPEPTETGHWEIYAPLFEADGRGGDFDGTAAIELNFGAAPDLQLTLALPVALSHAAGAGWRGGAGDIEVSAKYRLLHDEKAGVQIAVFPDLSLPTASKGFGEGRVNALLPVWVQKDTGPWSFFGGGGYAVHPGAGNRNYWTAGLAITRQLDSRTLIGIEADHNTADADGGLGSTSLGIGFDHSLKGPLRILASGGPTIEDRTGATGFHAFVALGWNL